MALNIKNGEVERLAAEVASLAGETKTEAIRRALIERRRQLSLALDPERRLQEIMTALEKNVWSQLPKGRKKRMSKAEREAILGYGPDGV